MPVDAFGYKSLSLNEIINTLSSLRDRHKNGEVPVWATITETGDIDTDAAGYKRPVKAIRLDQDRVVIETY